MARDWLTLKASIVPALTLSRDDQRGLAGSTADGRQVVVEHAHGSAVEWLVLRTQICAEGEMDPTLIHERNGRLAFAVMVLVQGSYWLRVAVPYDSAELDDPQQLVALLVDAARSLSPVRVAPSSTISNMFEHYIG